MTLWLQLLFAVAFFLAWIWVGRQIVPRIPQTIARQPVPWDGGTVLALALLQLFLLPMISVSLAAAISGTDLLAKPLRITPAMLLGNMFHYAVFVVVGVWVLRRVAGASFRQLGIDRLRRKWPADVRLGILAWIVALPPIYVLQVPLTQIDSGQHPVIEALHAEPSLMLWSAAWLAVVIGAPLAEEFLFRLTLQGWFNRLVEEWQQSQSEALHEESSADDAARQEAPSWVAAVPVLASSVAFCAVHAHHGLAPIALFPLALVLGVLYQRTRRLLPCVVCHSAFNAMNLAVLLSY